MNIASISVLHRPRAGACATALLAGLLMMGDSGTAWADPPCWAPAHGYRAKHGNKGCSKHERKQHKSGGDRYEARGGDRGRRDDDSWDVRRERRHAEASQQDTVSTGGLVGAAIGGYAGSKVGKGSGKLAATAGGAVAGYIVGQEVERQVTEPSR